MQIVLLSMDPVFLSPFAPPGNVFPTEGGRGTGEGAEQGLTCQISFYIRKEQIAFPKKRKRQGEKKTKHPSFGLMYRAV